MFKMSKWLIVRRDWSGSAPCSTVAHGMPVMDTDLTLSVNGVPSVAARFRVHQECLSSNVSKRLGSGLVESWVLWLLHEVIDNLWRGLKHSFSCISFDLAFIIFQLGDLLRGQAILGFELNSFVAVPLIKWDRVFLVISLALVAFWACSINSVFFVDINLSRPRISIQLISNWLLSWVYHEIKLPWITWGFNLVE